MPSSMYTILEAPVPFLVGLHRSYLDSTPPHKRPPGVVFVDLDCDQVRTNERGGCMYFFGGGTPQADIYK